MPHHASPATHVTRRSDPRPIPPPPPRPRGVPHTGERDADTRVASTDGVAPATPRNDDEIHRVVVRAWADPMVDEVGYDPRSRYVELFWLGVLGPTATWLLRRLAAGLDTHPDGYHIDLGVLARSMGLSYRAGRSSPFAKALARCSMFGLAHSTSDGLAVRRRIPVVAHRHLRRMPDSVRAAHERWLASHDDSSVDEFMRAHKIALALLEVGDDVVTIEHHLIALGVADVVAAAVADNAARLHTAD